MKLQITYQHEALQIPQALEHKARQSALKLGSYRPAKISHICPMEHNPLYVVHVLTNYRQLLLYISYDKNNLCMFVTSKYFPQCDYAIVTNYL